MTNTLSAGTAASLRRFARDARGQDLMEYGLLASLIATFLIGSLQLVGGRLNTLWQVIADGIPSF